MRTPFMAISVAAIGLLFPIQPVPGALLYQVIDLGTYNGAFRSEARGITQDGQVWGENWHTDYPFFLWRNESNKVAIPRPGQVGNGTMTLYGMNDSGQFAGSFLYTTAKPAIAFWRSPSSPQFLLVTNFAPRGFFFRGEEGSVARFADRLLGSPEIYGYEEREPEQSVNFVTCHDGFTLNALVSYNEKHNETNGEENRDGADDNRSWNCGIEGTTDDPAVERLRNRQVKNFLTATLLSLGMPMLLMGDEVRRTQGGNNNAYCQDNETSWFDWSLTGRHADVFRFARLLIARRLMRDTEHERRRMSLNQLFRAANKEWQGVKLHHPDWSDCSHSIAISMELRKEGLLIHMIFNAYWEPLEFELRGCVEVRI